MLATRVIPQILVNGRVMIKGQKFSANRVVGVPQSAVKIHQLRSVDEIILIDIAATPECRGPDLGLVEELAEECFSPLTVGGGVRSIDDISDLLQSGADKILIGTAALQDKWFLCEAVNRFGSSTIVGSIDAKRLGGTYLTYVKCGKHPLLLRPEQAAMQLEECGVGEIVLTSIDREGTMGGYDLDLIRSVSEDANIPVIAAGGCAGPQDMYMALKAGADAVAAGALFQWHGCTPREASYYLSDLGVETRCS